ncbi:MAG: glycosyltransferase family 9 protein [Chloroherpetonaceae bacterium]|nr:glycosyltransferase family 9 protein [Chloroherpetonaceae bacterium]
MKHAWLLNLTANLVLLFLLFLKIFPRKRKEHPIPSRTKRILLLRYDRLGDLICTTPLIDYLRSINPQIEIDCLASPNNEFLFREDERISNVTSLNGFSSLKEVWEMRYRNYDVIFSFIGEKPALDILFTTLTKTRGSYLSSIHEKRKYARFYDFTPELVGKHYAARWLSLAVQTFSQLPLSEEDAEKHFPLSIRFKPSDLGSAFFLKHKLEKNNFIGINLSSGSASRKWGLERWAEFISLYQKEFPYPIVIFSTPTDFATAKKLNRLFPTTVLFPYSYGFQRTAEIIKDALLVITPDTGFMHAAAAVHTAVIELYASISESGDIESWRPYGVRYRIVKSPQFFPLNHLEIKPVMEATRFLISDIKNTNIFTKT